jgi:hypothetical protein
MLLPRMMPSPTPRPGADADDERRPTAILLVYTWDMVRAILVFFVAFAAFGGGTDVSGKTVQLSTPVQILLALSSAALGAVLLLVGMLLTRHQAWVRRAQITVLGMAVGIGIATFAVVQGRSGFHVEALFGTLLLALVDLLAIVAMTGRRVAGWYRDPGPVPIYIGGLVAFWAAVSAAYLVIAAVG